LLAELSLTGDIFQDLWCKYIGIYRIPLTPPTSRIWIQNF